MGTDVEAGEGEGIGVMWWGGCVETQDFAGVVV